MQRANRPGQSSPRLSMGAHGLHPDERGDAGRDVLAQRVPPGVLGLSALPLYPVAQVRQGQRTLTGTSVLTGWLSELHAPTGHQQQHETRHQPRHEKQ